MRQVVQRWGVTNDGTPFALLSTGAVSRRSLRSFQADARRAPPPRKSPAGHAPECARRQAYATEGEEYVPPGNFALVCRGVYRSAFPKKRNFAFMRRLGLKAVLYGARVPGNTQAERARSRELVANAPNDEYDDALCPERSCWKTTRTPTSSSTTTLGSGSCSTACPGTRLVPPRAAHARALTFGAGLTQALGHSRRERGAANPVRRSRLWTFRKTKSVTPSPPSSVRPRAGVVRRRPLRPLTARRRPPPPLPAYPASALDRRNHPMLIHCNKGKARPLNAPYPCFGPAHRPSAPLTQRRTRAVLTGRGARERAAPHGMLDWLPAQVPALVPHVHL